MTAQSHHVAGIDGGGTRTRFVLADANGRILARREGRGSLLGAGRDPEIAEDIERHVRALAEEAGVELPLRALCAGLAGSAGRPEATRIFQDELVRLGIASRVSVIPDAEVAFEDAFGEGEGILVIAGTGSIALGRGEAGGLHRVGGWGALLGDEGSAYGIALDGIRAAMRGAEGLGEPTLLTSAILSRLRIDSLSGIFKWSQDARKGEIAALAPAVFGTAAAGDRVAISILEKALDGILDHARALRRALFPERGSDRPAIPGALVGGIVEAGGPLNDEVIRRFRMEGIEVVADTVDPPRGAVSLALRM
jgi:glucosamine kinase